LRLSFLDSLGRVLSARDSYVRVNAALRCEFPAKVREFP